MTRMLIAFVPTVMAFYMPFCAPQLQLAPAPPGVREASLWVAPAEVSEQELFYGPWGAERAPDPHGVYQFVAPKRSGVNRGMTVVDAYGRRWSVKQAPLDGQPGEGPIEVVVSRLLSAVGYHQPPVYYLPTFTLRDDWGTRTEAGGRFRLSDPSLKNRGEWSWQQNPFVGTPAYQGLLVLLMMVGSSDLKSANNTLYEHRTVTGAEHWYVVRDLGAALGETGRLAPRKGIPELFERQQFVTGVHQGYVEFDYHGWHQELVRQRITPNDVRWTSAWLAQLTDRQWRDAFAAGGYRPAVAERFITKLRANVVRGLALAE